MTWQEDPTLETCNLHQCKCKYQINSTKSNDTLLENYNAHLFWLKYSVQVFILFSDFFIFSLYMG